MKKSMVMFIFSILGLKYCFLKKFVSKIENSLLRLKFRTYDQVQSISHKLQISCKIARYGKSSISIFKEPFAHIKKR